ncbi:MAG: sigma 54-interacting transcriptional regulator [Deltaproteobacteria bacterium]|nr:sigma 54-interacting transcriptional regulator [Deltaproteobacteria bacterium]
MITQDTALSVLPTRQTMREVATAWEAFIAGEERGLEHVRPVIRESWRRSQRLGVDPYLPGLPLVLSAEHLETLQEQADLIAVAAPFFESMIQTWSEERMLLGVSDRHGRILHNTGHPEIVEQARMLNAVPGGSVAEEQIGTAVSNIVLAHNRVDYVLWDEHYCHALHIWAAVGAPISHPLTHEVIGVVGAVGEELLNPHMLQIIWRVALRLEQLLHHEELVRRTALLDTYHRFLLQHSQDIVLAIDGRGHVCGASPSLTQLLDAPQHILGKSLLRVPGLQVEGIRHLTRDQHERPYELHVAALARGLALRATAIPIQRDQQPVGTLVVLEPPSSPRTQRPGSATPWRTTYTFTDLVGTSPIFQDSLTSARQAARSDFPVLLLGESGTGKELLAHAIHAASLRCRGPFVPVNCGATNDELLAAELFGYVEGAFTGAIKGGKKGKLEIAHNGSLFLDEVEAMSPKMQVSLLRVLEEGRVTRVGGEQPTPVNVRIVAASNEDLAVAVREKRFRLDLYHRLATFPVALPPLRTRAEDIPQLAGFFLDQLGFSHLQLSPEAVRLLRRYAWPGNVRELKNILVRATTKAQGNAIRSGDLPPEIREAKTADFHAQPGSLRTTERELIAQALADTHGEVGVAAIRLGIHRATLYRKLKKYGLAQADRL